jgi:predicted dehydrogenase
MTRVGAFKRTKDIRTALIGFGGSYNIPRIHVEDMKRAGMTIDSIVDISAERRRAAEEQFGVSTYRSAKELFRKGNADLVAIVTPHNSHAKIALQCLRAGKHVVVEKPFAITTAECDAVIREARKRRRMLSVYHNRHWDGCIVEAVRQIRKRKVIGDVHRIEIRGGGYRPPHRAWRCSKSISGGILYDMGAHFLEWVLQLVDEDIVEVAGYGRNGFWAPVSPWKKDTYEDEMMVTVRFSNDVMLSLGMSAIDAGPKESFKVLGTKGAYVFTHRGYAIHRPKGKKKAIEIQEGENPGPTWHRFYRNIASHLVKGEDLVITPEWARRTIHIIDLACRSAVQRRALRAKYR